MHTWICSDPHRMWLWHYYYSCWWWLKWKLSAHWLPCTASHPGCWKVSLPPESSCSGWQKTLLLATGVIIQDGEKLSCHWSQVIQDGKKLPCHRVVKSFLATGWQKASLPLESRHPGWRKAFLPLESGHPGWQKTSLPQEGKKHPCHWNLVIQDGKKLPCHRIVKSFLATEGWKASLPPESCHPGWQKASLPQDSEKLPCHRMTKKFLATGVLSSRMAKSFLVTGISTSQNWCLRLSCHGHACVGLTGVEFWLTSFTVFAGFDI